MTRTISRKRPYFLVAAVLGFLISATALAQSVPLSPEQQRMLNQLPASQRDTVMRQLRQISQQRGITQQRAEQPGQDSAGDAADEVAAEDEDVRRLVPERLAPGSTVVVSVTPRDNIPATAEMTAGAIDALVERLQERNPYTLDDNGRLHLPGIDPINLAGLNENQASLRVTADPALRWLLVDVTQLPLDAVGTEALEPFGYDLFERKGEVASPAYDVPVPADFIVGPGDSLRIQLFGNRNAEYELPVQRDGTVQFPEIGPIPVAGMSFAEARAQVRRFVAEQLIGTEASVAMGELRVIQVFLVGDVNEPGAYTVGSLSTVTSVLTAGGGVAANGTLRSIQLMRAGRVVSSLDVYDLLLRGDASGDARVQSGDVVFVPPAGNRITVSGEVKRPAIYEFKGAATVDDMIGIAGGLLPGAMRKAVKIERIVPDKGLETLDANLETASGRQLRVRDGDALLVPSGVRFVSQSVRLEGNVQRPGSYEWRPGLRLSDVLPDARAVKAGSDLRYILIRREPEPNMGPTVLSADLLSAWAMRGTVVDLALEPRDTLYVFDLREGREQYVKPLIDELELRSSAQQPVAIASVGGSVNAPGQFPLEADMRVSDLVRASGGLAESAYPDEAELTRYAIAPDGSRTTSVIVINLREALRGDASANVRLQPFDYLNVRETPNWRDEEFIELVGEVVFPGRYPIRQGESLASVIERAGGLTDLAFPAGSVFTREALKKREKEQVETLAMRLERDLASLTLSDPGQSEALNVGQTLLDQLRSADPVGRLVIDLEKTLSGRGENELVVRDGDILRIPPVSQEVTVIGEVQYGTSHLYNESFDRDDYISKSGGVTAKADKRRIYVVRASGDVMTGGSSRFFARASGVEIRPGDTIVVPLDTDRVRPLTLWTSVSQILYNIAIAATAISRF